MHQSDLFRDATWKPSNIVVVTVKCEGCAATATIETTRRAGPFPPMPFDWSATGESRYGGIATWCKQCGYEGRPDAHVLQQRAR